MDELQLIEGCRKGKAKMQKLLFDSFADNMLAVCMRYAGNLQDAEELMLNGFCKFFEQIDRFVYTGEGSIAPWLRKIMINECLMFLRKKGQLIMMEEHAATNITGDELVTGKLAADDLFKCITDLPVGYRTVFNLYVIEEMSHKEIATTLGITEGTSKSQLNKAKKTLQELIKKRGGYHERFR